MIYAAIILGYLACGIGTLRAISHIDNEGPALGNEGWVAFILILWPIFIVLGLGAGFLKGARYLGTPSKYRKPKELPEAKDTLMLDAEREVEDFCSPPSLNYDNFTLRIMKENDAKRPKVVHYDPRRDRYTYDDTVESTCPDEHHDPDYHYFGGKDD